MAGINAISRAYTWGREDYARGETENPMLPRELADAWDRGFNDAMREANPLPPEVK